MMRHFVTPYFASFAFSVRSNAESLTFQLPIAARKVGVPVCWLLQQFTKVSLEIIRIKSQFGHVSFPLLCKKLKARFFDSEMALFQGIIRFALADIFRIKKPGFIRNAGCNLSVAK